jgi:GNAT superfamily N-acetyltransferase
MAATRPPKPRAAPRRRLEFHPLTPERFSDFEVLFGERGACGGCWCMWWRLPRAEFRRRKGAGNRRAMKRLVGSGTVPGILAYAGGAPVGWCCIGPREDFPPLARSRVLAPVDGRPVWSIVCFFVARPWRRKGITVRLIEAAVAHARRHGAQVVEGYPVVPRKGEIPAAFAYMGLPSAFRKAGFVEILRRSEVRPIVRIEARRS